MLEAIAIRTFKFIEDMNRLGFYHAFRNTFFFRTEWVPVVKNIEFAKPETQFTDNTLKLAELSKDLFSDFNYSYRYKSRFLQVKRNLQKGFKAFILVSDDIVVGDIWYVTWESTHHPHLHDHIDLFFLNPGEKDVYMFDMFIDPRERGRNFAVALMGAALYNLGQRGYKNAFGCFNIKNIPALWTHRILKFQELDHVLYSRYLWKRFAQKI